jgi:hypothetical protein
MIYTDSDVQHLLLTEAAAEAQRKGKPGQLVDPRPETVDGGEIKIRITPQLVHDIFDEYPVVATAYSDNVPSKVCHLMLSLSCFIELKKSSCLKKSSGNDIFNPNSSILTALLYDRRPLNTSSRTIPFLINI